MKEDKMRNVLFVDDEENVLSTVERNLKNNDYTVFTAKSAEDAIKIIHQNEIHIVVSDEMMPGMHGSELVSLIRKDYPEIISIILTGHASLDAALKSVNEGEVFKILTKPCNIEEIDLTIKCAIGQRESILNARQVDEKIHQRERLLKELEEKYPGITKK